jgi:hypothetical protein
MIARSSIPLYWRESNKHSVGGGWRRAVIQR